MKRIPRRIGRGLGGVWHTLTGPWPIYPSAMALIAVYGLFVSVGSRTQVGNKTVGSYFASVLPQWASIVATCLPSCTALKAARTAISVFP